MNASRWSSGSPNRGPWRVGMGSISLGPVLAASQSASTMRGPAEQVSPVGVTVDHPGRERETEPVVGIQELRTALSEPGPFVLIDGLAGLDRPAHRDQRLVDPVGLFRIWSSCLPCADLEWCGRSLSVSVPPAGWGVVMSMQPRPWPEGPADTAPGATRAFRRGALALPAPDLLGAWDEDAGFGPAAGGRGAPGSS